MKLIATIFSLAMFVNIGYYGIYEVTVICAKFNAQRAIHLREEISQFEIVRIPSASMQAFNGDEVWYNHKLYDVASKEMVRDTMVLHLYHDNDEESALSTLVNIFKADDGNWVAPGAPGIYKKNCKAQQDQTLPFYTSRYKPICRYSRSLFSALHINPLSAGVSKTPSPPPKA